MPIRSMCNLVGYFCYETLYAVFALTAFIAVESYFYVDKYIGYLDATEHILFYAIPLGIFAVALYKAKVLFYVWRDILIYIVWRLSKIPVYREQKVLCQHPLNNVVGWTDKVKVLVPLLNFGEGCLINIKCLVDYGDLLAGLLLVPLFKLRENTLVYVISPVVNL